MPFALAALADVVPRTCVFVSYFALFAMTTPFGWVDMSCRGERACGPALRTCVPRPLRGIVRVSGGPATNPLSPWIHE
jgi:hypothetical protein